VVSEVRSQETLWPEQALDVAELSGQLGDKEKAIAEYWADGDRRQ
jgi:hypothetical protein